VRVGATERLGVVAVGWAPLLAVAAGVDAHVGSSWKLGARFGWDHWLLTGAERCDDVALGVCTLPSYGHFDVGNALFSWQFGATFLFGAPH
jgi:hypothetical protein